jgi:hypothetical protein
MSTKIVEDWALSSTGEPILFDNLLREFYRPKISPGPSLEKRGK